MVEFGLKLEDNKVSKWSKHYIDYEKLKALLKKCTATQNALDEMENKYEKLVAANNTATEDQSVVVVKADEPSSRSDDREKLKEVPTETTALLDNKSVENKNVVVVEEDVLSHSSVHSFTSLTRKFSSNSLFSFFNPNANNLEKVTENLKFLEAEYLELHAEFNNLLSSELQKVTEFYDKTLKEMQEQFQFLLDSVEQPKEDTVYSLDSWERNSGVKLVPMKDKSGLSSSDHHFVIGTSNAANHTRNNRRKSRAGSRIFAFLGITEDDESDDEEEKSKNPIFELAKKEADSMKRAIAELHRNCKLLHNFASLNYTGFVKIIKKHDKGLPDKKGTFEKIFMCYDLDKDGIKAEKLSDFMVKKFAFWFTKGNLSEARIQLLPKQGDVLQLDWSQLRLGIRLGMCAILATWVSWDCIWGLVSNGDTTIGGRNAFPVYRACGGLLIFHWFWGFSIAVWTRFRVNYIFLFDFNPKIVRTPMVIFNDAVDESLVYLILMLLYYKAGINQIPYLWPPGVYPALLVLYTIKRSIFPWKFRGPLWSSIGGVIAAPFTSPTFFHTFVADVFTSMIKVFIDFAWTFCYILSGDFLETGRQQTEAFHWSSAVWYKNILIPLLCLLPLWIRFCQCLRRYIDTGKRFPNLANAGKYALSQTVSLFGTFHPLYLMHTKKNVVTENGQMNIQWQSIGFGIYQKFWLALFILSSLYSFIWDVYMDWGLGRKSYKFLGPRLMYPKKSAYYGVIFVDIILRTMWVLSLIPPDTGARFELPSYLTAVTMGLELFRRTIWGFFRLENEHRANTYQFRRIEFVPLHFSTQHSHKYKHEKTHAGSSVLLEVFIVAAAVITISVTSIVAARKASLASEQTEL